MNELAVADKGAEWRRLKALVLDSVSSPITKRVYNLSLDEFFAWYSQEPRPGFTKATVVAKVAPTDSSVLITGETGARPQTGRQSGPDRVSKAPYRSNNREVVRRRMG